MSQSLRSDERGSESVRDVPQTGQASTQAPAFHERASDNDHEHLWQRPEWWLVAATVALVYVTARLVHFTKGLWTATVRLSEDAKEVSRQQAIDTKKSLDIARDSADAARGSVMTLITAERAYVFAEVTLHRFVDVLLESKPPGTVEITVKFWNYGKTVAVITMIRGYVWVNSVVPQEFIQHEGAEKPLPPALAIAPNEAYLVELKREITIEELAEIRRWDAYLYIVGKMHYRTAWGKDCVTSFCWNLVYSSTSAPRVIPTRDSALNERT
jgi:hypothetical protein